MNNNKIILAGIVVLFVGVLLVFDKNQSMANKSSNTFEVKKVVDGDTLEIERYGRIDKVRLIGIDTPETLDPRKPVQCFGREASDKTKGLLTGKQVKLEFDPAVGEKDKYGRLLAYVWNDGKMINQELLEGGYATEYTYRSQTYKYQSEFKNAQSTAKHQGVGFWSEQTCNGKR